MPSWQVWKKALLTREDGVPRIVWWLLYLGVLIGLIVYWRKPGALVISIAMAITGFILVARDLREAKQSLEQDARDND